MPFRAARAMRLAAERSMGRSKEGKRMAGRITKPSRSRERRAVVYGSDVLGFRVWWMVLASMRKLFVSWVGRREEWGCLTVPLWPFEVDVGDVVGGFE